MARASRSTSKSKPSTAKKIRSKRSRPLRTRNNENTEKSKYFDTDTDEDDLSFDDSEGDSTSESESSLSDTEEDEPPRKKNKVTPKKATPRTTPKPTPKKTPKKSTAKSRLSKGGKEVSEDEEPWETFIAKEDTPEAGDIPYRDETIHPNTLHFLKDLVKNNDREWFWSHEKRYRAAEKDFKSFMEALSDRLMEIDPTIPPLPLKDVLFRIYRDVRFSNDKTLYKNHMSGAWSRTGRKGPYAAYYFHLQPNGRSGGKWHPDAGHLSRIRHTIHHRPAKFKKPLLKPMFKKLFDGEAGLLTAEDRLKTAPKGYAKDHPDIELLKLKSFRIHTRQYTDKEVLAEGFLDECANNFKEMGEFITMLNDVCMPDDDSDSSDEDDMDENGDEDEDEDEEDDEEEEEEEGEE